MGIKRLAFENVRCFKHLEIDFSSDETEDGARRNSYLLGQNGLGKSTILRSAAPASQISISG